MKKYLVSGKYSDEKEYRICGLAFAFSKHAAIGQFSLKDRFIFYTNFKAREIL